MFSVLIPPFGSRRADGEPPKGTLGPRNLIRLVVLRGYLVIAAGLMLARVAKLALGG
ncbi:MAG TPA: hypothetical protein VMF67_12245 [Rhizomicrobium sp.]|nr:hypothetical protein [Rhizomicrobium sp.]